MEILQVIINAAILAVLLVILFLLCSISKSLKAKKDTPNDEEQKPPLPTAQDDGGSDIPNDPPQEPPLPT